MVTDNNLNDNIVEIRRLSVPGKDEFVEVHMTQRFIDALRSRAGLSKTEPLTDEHVQLYLLGAISVAVEKAEREHKNAALEPVETVR